MPLSFVVELANVHGTTWIMFLKLMLLKLMLLRLMHYPSGSKRRHVERRGGRMILKKSIEKNCQKKSFFFTKFFQFRILYKVYSLRGEEVSCTPTPVYRTPDKTQPINKRCENLWVLILQFNIRHGCSTRSPTQNCCPPAPPPTRLPLHANATRHMVCSVCFWWWILLRSSHFCSRSLLLAPTWSFLHCAICGASQTRLLPRADIRDPKHAPHHIQARPSPILTLHCHLSLHTRRVVQGWVIWLGILCTVPTGERTVQYRKNHVRNIARSVFMGATTQSHG